MSLWIRLFGTTADPDKFLQTLQASRSLTYTKADRYKDFRQVFMGHSSPEQGQRVLAEIFKLGGMYSTTYVIGDANATLVRAGASDLCKRVMAIMNADPEREPNG